MMSNIPNTNNFHSCMVLYIPNINNYLVLSNYFYFIIVIFLQIFTWFQVTNNNPK